MLIRINQFTDSNVQLLEELQYYAPMNIENARQKVEEEGYKIMEEKDGGNIRMKATILEHIAEISVYPK